MMMKLRPDWQQLNYRVSRVARGGSLSLSKAKVLPLRPVSAQALVEFMLVSIPLLATMFGIFEFGLAFWDTQQLAQVTREGARQVASCANQCDGPPLEGTIASDTNTYKDVRLLQAVVDASTAQLIDSKTVQRNGTQLNPFNIDYVLLRRVADTAGATGMSEFQLNTSTASYDISGQYQLYVYDPNYKNLNKFLPFMDGSAADAARVGLPAASNIWNTSYLSSPCNGTPVDPRTGPIQNAQPNPATGFTFTCSYSSPSDGVYSDDPTKQWIRGRPVCQPTERFYVEVAYRHYWVAPFFPEVGATVSRPKDQNGFVVIKQRVYLKVEPRFFPVNGGTCPTGVS